MIWLRRSSGGMYNFEVGGADPGHVVVFNEDEVTNGFHIQLPSHGKSMRGGAYAARCCPSIGLNELHREHDQSSSIPPHLRGHIRALSPHTTVLKLTVKITQSKAHQQPGAAVYHTDGYHETAAVDLSTAQYQTSNNDQNEAQQEHLRRISSPNRIDEEKSVEAEQDDDSDHSGIDDGEKGDGGEQVEVNSDWRMLKGFKNPNIPDLRKAAPLFHRAMATVRTVHGKLGAEKVKCHMCKAMLLYRGSSMLQHVYKHAPVRLFKCPHAGCKFKGGLFSFMVIDHIRRAHPRENPYKFDDLRPTHDRLLADIVAACYNPTGRSIIVD